MSITNLPSCYVVVRQAGKILFVLRENTRFMDGYYSLPAGRVEANESYSSGAVREAKEEVGLDIAVEDLEHAYTAHRLGADGNIRTDVYFLVKDWSGKPVNNEPDRHSEVIWLPAHKLPDTIMDYQLAALHDIAQGVSYGEFGWPELH